MYFGKGLVSKPAYEEVYAKCKFPLDGRPGLGCDMALETAFSEVGPHKYVTFFCCAMFWYFSLR